MSFHRTSPEANKRSSPKGSDTDNRVGLTLSRESSDTPLGPLLTPTSILLRDQETIQTLQQRQPAHTENFLPEVDMASSYVLPQDMTPWSHTTSSLAASKIRSQGNLTPASSSISVSSSEAGPALFSGSAPHVRLGSSSSTIPNQSATLANSLDRLPLHRTQSIAQAVGGVSQPVLNQEHLRSRTPPHDLLHSPLSSRGQTPVVRSQASRFPSPVATPPRSTSPGSISLDLVVRSQRELWMSWINTQETWSPEVQSPHALSAALAAILTAAPSQRPDPVVKDIAQYHFSGSSLFPGPGVPSSSSSRNYSKTPVKGMKAGASDEALYDEELAAKWAYRRCPVESPAVAHVDFDFDGYDDDDDDDEDEYEYDSYELGTNEHEHDSGCDIGSNCNNNGDQDGQGDHTHQDDDEPHMSALAQGKRHAVSPSSCSRANKGNQCAETSCPTPSSSLIPSSSSSVDRDRQYKQDRQPERPKDCSGRDPKLNPFKCSRCPKRFRQLLDLNRHSEHHLPRPVQCLNCGRKLSRGDAMKRHVVSKRYRACLVFGWFAERDLMLGNFPEAPSTSSSSSSRSRSRSMAVQEEDGSSTVVSEDKSVTASVKSSTSEYCSSAYEATLSQLVELYPEDGSPVICGEPGNWFTIRNGVRVQIEVHGPFRVRACFPEWYLPRTPSVPRSLPPTSPDPSTPRPRKRASNEQNEKEDKKRRDYQG
ncbi:hypothetical protein BG006_010539 [Podila minutissima]|uniref:C2H2-type domain-containing protein n=1 Tax=Podila minutissima TaxID=64525 RepID=A0A9P5VPR0_9FUNG|nr:hypothetical protein BG006_010539 [Podila minutissima]